MNPVQIVAELVQLLNLQADALAHEEFEWLDELMERAAQLNQTLQSATAALAADELAALGGQLHELVEHADRLAGDAAAQHTRVGKELGELKHGRSAVHAYRQTLPRESALSYSRLG
jgi:ABC-type transporter Mla subunit MlaD